ncbi:MAG: hypothetical protein R3B06_27920 [Kofleriaceae bacterium]
MRSLGLAFVLVTVAASAGCSLYFPGDDDPGTCTPVDPPAPLELRNPETLQCDNYGGGPWCDPACGPCPLAETADQAPAPPWGVCASGCEGLDEFTCLTRAECRVTYDYDCFTNDRQCSLLTAYVGCFALSQTGGGDQACAGLDSWTCSSRHDCAALHSQVCDPQSRVCWQQFIECAVAPVAGAAQ